MNEEQIIKHLQTLPARISRKTLALQRREKANEQLKQEIENLKKEYQDLQAVIRKAKENK